MPGSESSNGSSPSLDHTTRSVAVVIPCFILLTLLLALTICLLHPRLWTLPAQRREAARRSAASRRSLQPPRPLLENQDGLLVQKVGLEAEAPVEKVAPPSKETTEKTN